MASTTAQLESQLARIDGAIASGSLKVAFGDRSREYRSMSELRMARQMIQGQLDRAAGYRRPLGFRVSTNKGLG